jgi:thiosulfate reductase cytochrome b subunit
MVSSGWRIYNASPIFDFRFPRELGLGGWLGGALQWHFAGMWLLALNGLVYLALNVFSGRFKRKFFPLQPAIVWNDLRAAMRGRLSHADPRQYSGLQRVAYLGVILDLLLLVAGHLLMVALVPRTLIAMIRGR